MPAEESTSPRPPNDAGTSSPRWLLLAYRVPAEPSSTRVGIWRELKRLGAFYPQQAVCILPGRPELQRRVQRMRERIRAAGGSSTYLEIPGLPEAQDRDLVANFRALVEHEYAEIVEECETRFAQEIEFERSRENFTYEESEEIREDLDKIRRWFDRVTERDWFDAPGRSEVEEWIDRCAAMLEAFEADVYERTGGADA